MKHVIAAALCTLALASGVARGGAETLDDFLAVPARVQDVKTLGLVILSQADPSVAAGNSAELRHSFWAQSPRAGLSPEEAEAVTRGFDHEWSAVARLVRERGMKQIAFLGIDFTLAKKAQDWYFGYTTPQGPVLIRLSVQFNDDGPMTVHGVQVWTRWDEVKAASHGIQVPATDRLFTVTYEVRPREATTRPAGDR